MVDFIANLKNNLEALEDVESTEATDFNSRPEWDSIAVLSLMAMIASEYGVNIKSSEISDAKTVGELWKIVGAKS